MKTEFQSGEIQLLLDCPKRRIEYLMKEIPITPEVSQVEGTGRAHIYSYKNLLQFLIAEHMAAIGLGMREIRFVISVLDKPSEILKAVKPPHPLLAKFLPKDLKVLSTEWPLDRPKGGLIARERKYVVAVYEPDQVKNTFENYYRDYYLRSQKDQLYLILSAPDAPDGNYFWLGITADLASFAKDLSGPTSHWVGAIHTILDLARIKGMANFRADRLESGVLDE